MDWIFALPHTAWPQKGKYIKLVNCKYGIYTFHEIFLRYLIFWYQNKMMVFENTVIMSVLRPVDG